jgi:hypothetical protein
MPERGAMQATGARSQIRTGTDRAFIQYTAWVSLSRHPPYGVLCRDVLCRVCGGRSGKEIVNNDRLDVEDGGIG